MAALAGSGWAAGEAHATGTGGIAYEHPSRPAAARPAQAPAPGAMTAATAPATIGADGRATAPADAPPAITALISAGNEIASLPYRYGGGHGSFVDRAFDCSGSVSFALHGAGLLSHPLDSTGLAHWGAAGPGAWISIYANKTHAYLVVAGLRFDTSGRVPGGTRWQASARSGKGFTVRHPDGL